MAVATNATMLERDGSAAKRPIAGRFVSDWLLDLAALAQSRSSVPRGRYIVLWQTADGVRAFVKRGRKIKALDGIDGRLDTAADWTRLSAILASLKMKKLPVAVRLADDQVLAKTLTFPSAVQDVLEPVITNQLRRLMPWPQAETQFAFKTGPHSGAPDMITVSIVAVRRRALDSIVTGAAKAGIDLQCIDHDAAPDASDAFVLMSASGKNIVKRASVIGWLLGCLMLVSLSVGAIGYLEWLHVRQSDQGLSAQILGLKKRLAQHEQHLSAGAAAMELRQRLVERRLQEPAAVQIIDALTHAIPDHTFLTGLELEGRRLVMRGLSGDAASLIHVLERSGTFQHVRFTGPTTRDHSSGKERFMIAADISFRKHTPHRKRIGASSQEALR